MKFKTINGWTKEKMIEAIYKGNNGTVARQDTRCVYLTNSGNKCAVGCFIPDGHAAFNAGAPASSIIWVFKDLIKIMPLDLPGLLKLQFTHDGFQPPGDVRETLVSWINNNVEDAS